MSCFYAVCACCRARGSVNQLTSDVGFRATFVNEAIGIQKTLDKWIKPDFKRRPIFTAKVRPDAAQNGLVEYFGFGEDEISREIRPNSAVGG